MGGTYSRHGRGGHSIGLLMLASGLYTLEGVFFVQESTLTHLPKQSTLLKPSSLYDDLYVYHL